MIGKIHKRASPTNALNYVARKEGARYVTGNMAGRNLKELAKEFQMSQSLRPEVKQPYYHISLSLRNHRPDDFLWKKAIDEYVHQMGLKDCQYVAFRHSDTGHDHVHIIASRIRVTDGHLVSDSHDYHRSQQALREIEQKSPWFESEPSSPKVVRKRLNTKEYRYFERTGYETGKMELQRLINKVGQRSQTFAEFRNRLAEKGIVVGINQTRTGKIRGISYALEVPDGDGWKKIAVAGNKLGKAYTWDGIEREFGVSRTGDMNREAYAQSVRDYNLERYGSTEGQRQRRLVEREKRHTLKLKYDEAKEAVLELVGKEDFEKATQQAIDRTVVAYAADEGMKPDDIALMVGYSSHRARAVFALPPEEREKAFDSYYADVLKNVEDKQAAPSREREMDGPEL